MAKVTAKELAAMLGLSQSAVSLALRGKPGVSDKTRCLVQETAMKMGLERMPDPEAASSGKRLYFIIFVNHLVSISENTTFSTFLLKGAAAAASSFGYSITVHYVDAGDSISSQLEKLLNDADGILLLGTDLTEDSNKEFSLLFEKHPKLPVVVLDSEAQFGMADCVCNDNFEGARSATTHLLDRGCQAVGYFRSQFRNQNFEDREAGVRAALAAAGKSLDIIVDTPVSFDGAYTSVLNFLRSGQPLPDGVFAENDIVAAAAIRACNACGIKVPDQISIVGFDNIPICELCAPALTTVHSHKERLGQLAVSILHARFKEADLSPERGRMKIYLSTYLQIRDSVK